MYENFPKDMEHYYARKHNAIMFKGFDQLHNAKLLISLN